MRKLSLILTVAMALVATTAHTEEVTTILEGLVKQDRKLDELEQLVKLPKKDSLYVRIESFLKRHKVRKPEYYAQIIIAHPMPESQKKVMAAILVPETRGNENAVSPVGAIGPWQVMPAWKKRLKIKGSLKNPVVNLDAAVKVYNIHAEDARHNQYKTLVYYSGRTPGYAQKVTGLVGTI